MPTVVAVDLDEVLGSFVQALCNYHNEKYATNLKLSDFHSYTFAEVSVYTRVRLHAPNFSFHPHH